MTKATNAKHASVVVLHGANAKAVIRHIELSKGTKRLTVNGAIEMWVTWMNKNTPGRTAEANTSYIHKWARDMDLGDTPLDEIEEEHINGWINHDDGTKLGTRQVRLSVVRSLFRFIAIKDLLNGPDPSRLARVQFDQLSHKQKESKVTKIFTPEQFDRLLDHLTTLIKELQPKIQEAEANLVKKRLLKRRQFLMFWRAAVVIGRCAGLRLGDICLLEWECFGKKLTVWTDKRDKRVQPYVWNQELFDEIVSQIPIDDTTYCFPEERAIYKSDRRSLLSTQFSRLLKHVNIKGRTYHGLRHTYSTECDRAGISKPHISASLGHSDSRTTEGYIH